MASDVKLCAQVSECSPGDTGRRMASPYQELLSDRARAALGTIACGITPAPGDLWRRPYKDLNESLLPVDKSGKRAAHYIS